MPSDRGYVRDPEISALTAQIQGLAGQIHALVGQIEKTVDLLSEHEPTTKAGKE